MDPRRLNVTPGSGSGGRRGRSGWNTSSRRRRRMPDPPSGTRLMPVFNAAADGEASRLSSLQEPDLDLDLVLDEWRSHYMGTHSLHGAPPAAQQQQHIARLLFGSPMRSPAADDNVLIMDGVLVANSESTIASRTRRSYSFGTTGLAAASSPGSSGGRSSRGSNFPANGFSSSDGGFSLFGSNGGFGSNGLFAQGRDPEQFLMMQVMRQRFAEIKELQNSSWSNIDLHLFPPSLTEPVFSNPTLRAVSSYTDAAVTVITQQSDTESEQPPPAPATSFAWPPTAEQDTAFSQLLYGPTTSVRRRLPVFEAVCPAD